MAKKSHITIGTRFHRWLVTGTAKNDTGGHNCVQCRCDCGTERPVAICRLRNGKTKSCGCLRADQLTTHGNAKRGNTSGEYYSWASMNSRCNSSTDAGFKHYGGRGISICARWEDFETFLDDMGKQPSPRHSIERIDNDGNYEPSNCNWATQKAQCRNQRKNIWLAYRGESRVLAELVESHGKDYMLVYLRLRRGWDIDRALHEPKHWRGQAA